VIFRFAVQIGILPLTGTTNRQHMQEDLESGKIHLSAAELKMIQG
jgi:diketogulonate reductase-like aldo/keto reductase